MPIWLSEGFADYVAYDASPVPLSIVASDVLDEAASLSEPVPSGQCVRGGTVLTVTRGTIPNGVVVLRNGRIEAVGGPDTAIPANAEIVDAAGRFVSPGIIDAHSHIGELAPWKFYNLAEPVKPTVYDYARSDDYLAKHLDLRGIERGLVLPNYGIPVQEQPFSLNDLVLESALLGAVGWVSGLVNAFPAENRTVEL